MPTCVVRFGDLEDPAPTVPSASSSAPVVEPTSPPKKERQPFDKNTKQTQTIKAVCVARQVKQIMDSQIMAAALAATQVGSNHDDPFCQAAATLLREDCFSKKGLSPEIVKQAKYAWAKKNLASHEMMAFIDLICDAPAESKIFSMELAFTKHHQFYHYEVDVKGRSKDYLYTALQEIGNLFLRMVNCGESLYLTLE